MSLIEKLSEFMSPYYVLTGNIKEKSKTVNNYGISVCLYQLEANSVQNGLKNANGKLFNIAIYWDPPNLPDEGDLVRIHLFKHHLCFREGYNVDSKTFFKAIRYETLDKEFQIESLVSSVF
jgi:hypothetical protein